MMRMEMRRNIKNIRAASKASGISAERTGTDCKYKMGFLSGIEDGKWYTFTYVSTHIIIPEEFIY